MSKFFPRKRMQADLRMKDDEFDTAIKGLLEKGLMEEQVIDNEPHYRITDLGKSVHKHSASDPKNQN